MGLKTSIKIQEIHLFLITQYYWTITGDDLDYFLRATNQPKSFQVYLTQITVKACQAFLWLVD